VNRTKRIGRALSAIAVLGMVATACGSSGDTASSSGSATAQVTPVKGGTLVFLHQFETRGYDPLLASGALGSGGDSPQMYAVFDTLVYEDQVTGKIVPRLAESFDSTDAITWTLKLRANVKFSDGTPYDADAVKFNWERIADPANKSSNAVAVTGIASMQVVDPQTLKITLKAANSQFPRGVARRVGTLGSPTAIRAKGAKFATEPVGAGPFLLDSWVRDSEARFKRNPTYWDAPRPYLDALTIRQIPDGTQRYNTVRSGEAQMAFLALAADVGQQAKSNGLQLWTTAPAGGSNYLLNAKKAPFKDIKARQAVAYAFNLKQLNDVVYRGANINPEYLFGDKSPFYDSSLKLPSYDKAKAQQLLDELAATNGRPLEFTISHSATAKAPAEFLQAQVAEFKNIKVNLLQIQNTDILAKAAAGDYDMMSFQISAMDPEPDLYDAFHTGATRNFGAYSNPEMDTALEKGRATLDERARADAYKTMQRLLARDVPTLFYNRPVITTIGTTSVQGVELTNFLPRFEQIFLKS
jgi:peptide/nickel transport system substrate-binding protein